MFMFRKPEKPKYGKVIALTLAAVAGAVYVIATYGDKIVAWAKNLLNKCNCTECCCGNDCCCEDDCCCGEEDCCCAEEEACCCCEEAPAEEAAEEAAPAEGSVQAEEADFEG